MERRNYFRIGLILAAGAGAIGLGGVGCSHDGEGDRCNPDLAQGSGDCGSGLRCGGAGTSYAPANCPENYCCPDDGKSDNPNCQTGCDGGDVSICLADYAASATLPDFCAALCTSSKVSLSFCASSSSSAPVVPDASTRNDGSVDQ